MVYIDFVPKLVQYYGGGHSKYESFRRLVQRANDWLERNPQVRIITCETVGIKPNEYYLEDFDNKITIWDEFFIETRDGKTHTARHPQLHTLRIWYLGLVEEDSEESDDEPEEDPKKSGKNKQQAQEQPAAPARRRKSLFDADDDDDDRPRARKTLLKDEGRERGKSKGKSVKFAETDDVLSYSDDDVTEDEDDEWRPQQIAYVNIMPCRYSSNEYVRHKRRFEPLGAAVGRFNEDVAFEPLPGTVISVETITVPCHANGCEHPDDTFWRFGSLEFHIIRLYYLVGEPVGEKIGFADFIPLNDGIEDFTDMVNRANKWIQKQEKIHVTNLKTEWCNVCEDPIFADSQSPLRRVWINAKLVRVLRVWYTRPLEPDMVEVPPNPVLKWTLFEAEILVQKTGERIETLVEVIRRALIDLENLEAQILNVETVVLFSEYSDRKLRREEMAVNVGLQTKHMLRFYIFGNIFTNQLRITIPKRPRDTTKATGNWKELGARLGMKGSGGWPIPTASGKGQGAKSKACVVS